MLLYRSGAMACIFRRSDKKVLLCHRTKGINVTSWQFPQGGIKKGDTPEKTVFKEVYEEIGIKESLLKIGAAYPEWLLYTYPEERGRPRGFDGQKHKVFLLEFLGEDKDINLNIETPPEFDQFKWVSIDDVIHQIIDFKKPTYEKILPYFKDVIEKMAFQV